MSIEIYYYSGTGNSLHAARELEKRLPDAELIPILKFRKREHLKTKGETVGFVFPVYFTSIPAPMREFIEKLDLTSAKYIFMVATRIGTFTIAQNLLKKILKKKGKKLDSYIFLNMASNSPTGLKPGKGDPKWVQKTSKEEIDRMEEKILTQLDMISRKIKKQEGFHPGKFPNPLIFIIHPILNKLTRNMSSEVGYRIDDTCIGCGTCEKVCLSGKVKLSDGKPIWQEGVQCYYCFACFNFCPQQSILVNKKYDRKDGRYHHPEIALEDIASQKLPAPE
jgi:ferredoxin